MTAPGGNCHIAESTNRHSVIMRPLMVLLVVLLLAAPLLPAFDRFAPSASADSFPKWNKVFHLHDGATFSAGLYDWLNSSGPYNPPYLDYDGDGRAGISIKKSVPPGRYHAWYLYPPVASPINISGPLAAYIWARSEGNNSATVAEALFYDILESQFSDPFAGSLIGSTTSMLTGPFYSEFQLVSLVIPSVNYTLASGHILALVVQRGDSLNDWLIVNYDRTDYDSIVTLNTNSFVSMKSAWTQDVSGITRNVYSDLERIDLYANVSDPFGAGDILGAYVAVMYSSNQSVAIPSTPLSLQATDGSSIPYWKRYNLTLPNLGEGSYTVNVTARDAQGYPSWLNLSLTIVYAHHFNVDAPATIVSGTPFAMNVSARDSAGQIVQNWVGTVNLLAVMTNRVIPSNGSLSTTTVQINTGDQGQIRISNQSYNFSEERIYIKASYGPRIGFSDLINVMSNPVVTVEISPSSPPAVELPAGRSQVFTATGRDYLGNINTSWTPYWNVTPPSGIIVPSGLTAEFTAIEVGYSNLTCTNNLTGASANVSITAYAGSLVRINISSPSYPLVVQERTSTILTATGFDSYNNTVSITGAIWHTSTSGTIAGSGSSATFTAGYLPESGTVECRLGSVVGILYVVVTTSTYGPYFDEGLVYPQVRMEDSPMWEFDLTGVWQHVNNTDTLVWWVEDVNTSLYFVLHDPTDHAIMQFYTQPNQNGNDAFKLWVTDQEGYMAYQVFLVNITPVNDAPVFVNHPPTELHVTFDTDYTFDYTYYVDDVDNSLDELNMSSDGAPNVWFDSLTAHFNYSGKTAYFKIVKIKIKDPMDGFSELNIVVKVTSDIPPSLNRSLPDLIIDEGVVNFYAFDLDEYFYDLDSSILIFTTGFENIPAPVINSTTHRVYFSAPTEWSGVTVGTFTATDPQGALKVDTINVTVIPVNDPPVINSIGTIYVRYSQTYYLYLSPYVFDPDNSMESLVITLNDTHVIRGSSPMGAERLEILFPANLSGPVYTNPYSVSIMLNVSDPIGLTTSSAFVVCVTDNQPPQVVAQNPDQLYFTFPEDEYLNDTFRLYDLIYDPDDSVLSFNVTSSGDNVHFTIVPSGYVSLSASENWSGTETLSIVGMDSKGAWASVQVFVIVTPVNDAPIVVNPLTDTIVKGGPRNTQYDIAGVFFDSDNEFLTITAGPEANAQVVGTTLFVSLPAGKDVITVTLIASDGELTSSIVIFKVGVRKTVAEQIGYPYTLPLVLLAAGVAGYFLGTRIPRPYALENLFLIHNDGRLVAHVTKEENTNLDKDVVSAMFTAVQEFVRDSFQKGEVGLKKLEIGDKNVMIEKGKFAYLALIYSGWPQKDVFEMLPVLLKDIENRYNGRLERWNGTAKTVGGAEKMLQEYMSSSFKPGTWHEEDEIAEEEWVDILNKEA